MAFWPRRGGKGPQVGPSSTREDSAVEGIDGDLLDLNSVYGHVFGGRPCLVAFGGLGMKSGGIPPFEFLKVTSDLDCDLLFIRDLQQRFYHFGIPGLGRTWDEMAGTLATLCSQSTRLVFVGHSSGGHAALILGALCRAHAVLSFSPLTFLDRGRRLRSWDRRWPLEISKINRSSTAQHRYLDVKQVFSTVGGFDLPQVLIVYPRDSRLNRKHALRMAEFPNVCLKAAPGAEHSVVRAMRDNGLLNQHITSAVNTGSFGS